MDRAHLAGYVGQELTKLLLKVFPDVKLITTDIQAPPAFVDDASRLKTVKADLGDPEQVKSLFEGETIGGVFALQSVPPSLLLTPLNTVKYREREQ